MPKCYVFGMQKQIILQPTMIKVLQKKWSYKLMVVVIPSNKTSVVRNISCWNFSDQAQLFFSFRHLHFYFTQFHCALNIFCVTNNGKNFLKLLSYCVFLSFLFLPLIHIFLRERTLCSVCKILKHFNI